MRRITFDKVSVGEFFWGTTTRNKYVKGIFIDNSRYPETAKPVGVCVETQPGHESHIGKFWVPETLVIVDRPLTFGDLNIGDRFEYNRQSYMKIDMHDAYGNYAAVNDSGRSIVMSDKSVVAEWIPF